MYLNVIHYGFEDKLQYFSQKGFQNLISSKCANFCLLKPQSEKFCST